MAAIVEAAN